MLVACVLSVLGAAQLAWFQYQGRPGYCQGQGLGVTR